MFHIYWNHAKLEDMYPHRWWTDNYQYTSENMHVHIYSECVGTIRKCCWGRLVGFNGRNAHWCASTVCVCVCVGGIMLIPAVVVITRTFMAIRGAVCQIIYIICKLVWTRAEKQLGNIFKAAFVRVMSSWLGEEEKNNSNCVTIFTIALTVHWSGRVCSAVSAA